MRRQHAFFVLGKFTSAKTATFVNSTTYGGLSLVPNDPIPLSPQHLLTFRETVIPKIDKVFRENVSGYGQMRWRRMRYLSEQFWTRWKSDYLCNLKSRNKWQKPSINLRVDDVVLLKDDSPRCLWPIGKVVEAVSDQDGRVRKVKPVCAIIKGGKPKVFQRAILPSVKLM